jgi:hypothetical protein
MWEVQLHQGGAREMRVCLRDPTGADERVAADGSAAAATRLLDRLATRVSGAAGLLASSVLSISEHDRLLTAIYVRLYSEKAVCHASCATCSEPFEFAVPLDRVLEEQEALAAQWGAPDSDGWWTAGERIRFRAPTAAEAAATEPAALRALCLSGADPGGFDLEAALEAAAPSLSIDLDIDCPHCTARQHARFDIARHLARSLQRELPFLVREAHLIASAYGWTHAEIMALSRNDRRAYASLIASERSARPARRRAS